MSNPNIIIREALATATKDAIDQTMAGATMPQVDKRDIVERVITEAAPVVLNQTNNEPLYQSRVVIGNVTAIVIAGAGLIGLLRAGITDAEVLAAPIGVLLANGFSLYGRLIAKKPLGS